MYDLLDVIYFLHFALRLSCIIINRFKLPIKKSTASNVITVYIDCLCLPRIARSVGLGLTPIIPALFIKHRKRGNLK